MSKKVIVWFRSDLRLHDNEALTDALTAGDQVVPNSCKVEVAIYTLE